MASSNLSSIPPILKQPTTQPIPCQTVIANTAGPERRTSPASPAVPASVIHSGRTRANTPFTKAARNHNTHAGIAGSNTPRSAALPAATASSIRTVATKGSTNRPCKSIFRKSRDFRLLGMRTQADKIWAFFFPNGEESRSPAVGPNALPWEPPPDAIQPQRGCVIPQARTQPCGRQRRAGKESKSDQLGKQESRMRNWIHHKTNEESEGFLNPNSLHPSCASWCNVFGCFLISCFPHSPFFLPRFSGVARASKTRALRYAIGQWKFFPSVSPTSSLVESRYF